MPETPAAAPAPAAPGSTRTLAVLRQMHALSGERDRNRVGHRLLSVLKALYGIERGALYQYFLHANRHWLALNALLAPGSNAPDGISIVDPHQLNVTAHPDLEALPHLRAPLQDGRPYQGAENGDALLLWPLLNHDTAYGLVEMRRQAAFTAAEVAELAEVIGILQDHLNLIHYAETDTLTGLLNRKTFEENLDRVLSGVQKFDDRINFPEQRQAPPDAGVMWLAAMDIDYFKRINDTHGHIIGDEVLILMAKLMRESFRLHDQLFRFGGEEFIAVIRTPSREATGRVLERFRASVEKHAFPIVDHVTLSLGFTMVDPMDTPTELVARADAALYHAKNNGRNQVVCYEDLQEAGLVEGKVVAHKAEIELF